MKSVSKENEKKSKMIKVVAIITSILIILGGLTFAYFKFPTFNNMVENLIGKLPWSTSAKNQTMLTEEEIDEKMDDLAEHYLSVDFRDAANELYIIKKDDEKLYSNIIKLMNKKSTGKTGEIIKLVRDLENRKDLLTSLHDELTREKQNNLNSEIEKLENQDLIVTIDEVKNDLNSSNKSKEELSQIFNNMDDETLAYIIYYLDEESKNQVLGLLNDDKRFFIENQILDINTKKIELKDLANLYETKSIEFVVNEIGNTEQYSMEELGVIYSNLSIIKAAEILSNIEDDDFVRNVLKSIRREQELNNVEPTADKISNAIEFIKEYNRKVDDLVKVYEEMSPEKVALITEKMIENNATVTNFQLESEPAFEVTDAVIITDVLSRLKEKTLSKVINYMSTENAYKLTQMLAKP